MTRKRISKHVLQQVRVIMSSLEQLRKLSVIVADTGDFEELKLYKPTDATTNPSLILLAAKMERYKYLLKKAIDYGVKIGKTVDEKVTESMDYLSVLFGVEILKTVSGRVSTEIDARLSFNTSETIKKALKLVQLYSQVGIDKSRVLIKVAATWEGIKAAEILEKEHSIKCNLTLIFSFAQAIACAESRVTLISPFVGRILDWYIANTGVKTFEPKEDPGVVSVTKIYNYFKKFDYGTVVMGASFRNINEVKYLAGCDLLTISPVLLKQLEEDNDKILPHLSKENAKLQDIKKVEIDEPTFRWMLNEDKMATDKLSEGIRKFALDTKTLEEVIRKQITNLNN